MKLTPSQRLALQAIDVPGPRGVQPPPEFGPNLWNRLACAGLAERDLQQRSAWRITPEGRAALEAAAKAAVEALP